MLLNEKISIIRKMNNITQEAFAEELVVSRQTVSKWEKGASIPDVQMLIKISDYYNITLDQLIRDEYDLPGIIESDDEKNDNSSAINIEKYMGKICDVSMNSFRYGAIRNVEIIGICDHMVCFIRKGRYGYFNLKKSLGLLIKKEGTSSLKKDELICGKCSVYVNKGTYFGGMTYAFSEIREVKEKSIYVTTGKFESEISLDEVSVILMK